MDQYSTQPKDQIYVKGYGFLSFFKSTGKNMVVSMVKRLLILLKNLEQIR